MCLVVSTRPPSKRHHWHLNVSFIVYNISQVTVAGAMAEHIRNVMNHTFPTIPLQQPVASLWGNYQSSDMSLVIKPTFTELLYGWEVLVKTKVLLQSYDGTASCFLCQF